MKQSNHLQFDGHLFAAESCTTIKTGTTEDTAAYAQAQENLPICLLAYAVPIHACIRQQDTSFTCAWFWELCTAGIWDHCCITCPRWNV